MKKLFIIYVLFTLIACQSASQTPVNEPIEGENVPEASVIIPKKQYLNYTRSLKSLLDSLHLKPSFLNVLILKSEYELVVMLDTMRIKSYPVVFGGNPVDDKLRQGDQCTPEGVFGMRDKYPHRSWTKFIWIDYPNQESRKKYKAAKAEGRIPPNADIGGDVGIHGIDDGFDNYIEEKRNWTLGCISMKNADVSEIYPFFTAKTRIEIRK